GETDGCLRTDDRFRRDQTASNDCQVESQLIHMISTRRCSCSTARSRSPATAKPKLSAPATAARCRPERYMRNKSGRRACATSPAAASAPELLRPQILEDLK